MAIVIEHDWKRWGAAFDIVGRPVTRIADVVRSRTTARFPQKVVADEVLESIARLKSTELFLLRQNNLAGALQVAGLWDAPLLAESWFGYDVSAAHDSEFYQWWDWTDGAESPFNAAKGDPRSLAGALGLLACMHFLWTQSATTADDLDNLPTGAIAILTSDAQRLFGFEGYIEAGQVLALQPSKLTDAAELFGESRGGLKSLVVLPDGGSWPHVKGQRWIGAEHVAMRKMRAAGMTDAAIAVAVGCKRQVVGQQIGSAVLARATRAIVPAVSEKLAA